MKKKSARHASKQQEDAAFAERQKRRQRRWLLRGGLAAAVVLPLGAFGLWRYEQSAQQRRDLSVIGNGTPTVVQVFDPRCAECRQLRDRLSGAIDAHPGPIQYRLADRSTTAGGLFASRHQADHLTVFFFGSDGDVRRRESGMQERAALSGMLRATYPVRSAGR